MYVLVIGGRKKADYLVGSLLRKHHHVTVINDDREYCKYLSRRHEVPVLWGDASKLYVYEAADMEAISIVIALTPNDADNLVICQLIKKNFDVTKAVAMANNPRNVDVFKKLGVDIVVNSTYIVGDMIEQLATLEEIINYLPLEEGRVSLTEIDIKADYPVVNKKLTDIDLADEANIGCIMRGVDVVIPNNNTVIMVNDRLIILAKPTVQNKVITTITGKIRS
ncbi:potassium transporter TrkA [endosymbiont 'TC1' of Trimyema compressum]|uniref:potassium channel family protein n=1 Tax=endosymbiont 'TC1' of Trimyema compressum TaxID=243899 RepID=UPI0007F0DB51|nr:TrkA family potassium uptake protein [endosymbiont 'TC1' of Trimyema compressum]AMP20378.1 potassium transporter TrkA [endosymbiont 'TC1' of Trimyema compressum]